VTAASRTLHILSLPAAGRRDRTIHHPGNFPTSACPTS
jgi:hypothetical protein